ncbi:MULTISPECIES: DUF3397 domain-containing protein [Bacillaceae]|uniref:DUF3397 domain-containing protein n=1 Tax=Bacillaceae TaxID=186817 RepID=UPI00118CC7EF|nr:DUF3397 domain-containing protein [Bacillus sp. S3]QCJ41960.1 DUF3397 domain-containing protein [Bacillus sp. S3]
MSTILSAILTVFFTLPLLGSLLVFIVIKFFTKKSRKSLHAAVDYTTLLYIISVHFLIVTIWGKSLFWLIILLMILIAMVFVIVHWKVKEEIVLKKVVKGFWRFNFLVFFLAYLTISLYGIIRGALTFTFST